ncbi:hypothetical protein BJ508DRAFT_333625 [Ascobolus immersus RN42]|uniref:Uncharacterized protein n=1 Tax=Ascobolus immersus RN42 TaxID=1160509 RepID=A0A3N4HIW1_ASCIM|nr:hypothetical protein BJ508DRAFT_333625 [Ascobolus immersus RN42]
MEEEDALNDGLSKIVEKFEAFKKFIKKEIIDNPTSGSETLMIQYWQAVLEDLDELAFGRVDDLVWSIDDVEEPGLQQRSQLCRKLTVGLQSLWNAVLGADNYKCIRASVDNSIEAMVKACEEWYVLEDGWVATEEEERSRLHAYGRKDRKNPLNAVADSQAGPSQLPAPPAYSPPQYDEHSVGSDSTSAPPPPYFEHPGFPSVVSGKTATSQAEKKEDISNEHASQTWPRDCKGKSVKKFDRGI